MSFVRTDVEPGSVHVEDVSKTFRLYRRKETTLKEVILRGRRGVYEEFHALRDVSFDIEPGQAVGVLGRNGSGKSTLLKLLGRILEPDKGDLAIGGRVSALLELGAGFHPEYSAVENVFLSGAVYGVPRADLERKLDDIIAFAELERFADNPVKTYSSGMYARLGFSIAVNVDPDVLLIDEVLAVGDASFQARCMDRMMEFRDAGKTLILVTHDLGAVEAFCERVMWIEHGELQQDGLPHHVIRRYVDSVTDRDEQRAVEDATANPAGMAVADHVPIHQHHPLHLKAMSFVDGHGDEREVFHNGESLRVRVHYTAKVPIPDPICEIVIENFHGVRVTQTSTRLNQTTVDVLPAGEGYFEWCIDDIRLTPGTYYFTPRLIERTGVHAFDEHIRWYRLRVHAGEYRERNGVVVIPGSWTVQPTEVTPGALDEPVAAAPVDGDSDRGSSARSPAGTPHP